MRDAVLEHRGVKPVVWSEVLAWLVRIGDRLDMDVEDWPLFERHAVLPHGLAAWHTSMRPFAQADWPAGKYAWDEEDNWPCEAIAWWRTDELPRCLHDILRGHLPMPPSDLQTFSGTHVTEGAKETCRALWRCYDNWAKAMAVWMLAWCRDADERGGRNAGYEANDVAASYLGALELTASRALGAAHPDWHHACSRVSGAIMPVDPINYEPRVLDGEHAVLVAFLLDVHRSQTSWGRLVHLVRDPTFDPIQFSLQKKLWVRAREARAAARNAAIDERLRQNEAERARRADALRAEEQRRQGRKSQRARTVGVKAMAAELGVSMGCLQNWLRKGLSDEQIQWLAKRPAGTSRGKSLDDQLEAAGLIPGLPPAADQSTHRD